MAWSRRYVGRSGSVQIHSQTGRSRPGRLEAWQERYHGYRARCPACGTWRYMRMIQDQWASPLVPKTRLQCECGHVFTHDPRKHDHLLERTAGTGTRGIYQPRGYRQRQHDERVYRD